MANASPKRIEADRPARRLLSLVVPSHGSAAAPALLFPGTRAAPRATPSHGEEGQPRRALNLLVAAIGLVLTAPLLLLIALLVRLSSPGPVLYTQWRIGLNARGRHGHSHRRWEPATRDPKAVPTLFAPHPDFPERRGGNWGGRRFRIYKFRTMYMGPGPEKQTWAAQDDPRVTPIGRILRRTRLDELPQLFNVLKGDMNVVGPRPEQPEIFFHLRKDIPGYERRQTVLPGITGWAQINQEYDRTVEDVRRKVALDLEYIRRSSVVEDLLIMLRTPQVMFRRKGCGW